MIKILIVIGQMECGGSEQVVNSLHKILNNLNYSSQLLILGNVDKKLFPDLVNYIVYSSKSDRFGKFRSNIEKIKFIRSQINYYIPDIVVSFIDSTNILTILSMINIKIPLIISERNNPEKSKMSKIWFYLRFITYPFANCLVVANNGLKDLCFKKKYNKNIKIIPNIVKEDTSNNRQLNSKKIIAVGSLTSQKRYDLLIDAIDVLKNKNRLNGYTLNIFGSGYLFEYLRIKITSKKLESFITLHGQVNSIYDEYNKSEIFVLSSEYEGQPNVLLEAMSCGLACIATDCDFGPGEIIQNNLNGLLVAVNNVEALASSIERLIYNYQLRTYLGGNAKKTIKEKYTREKIAANWISLFKEFMPTNENIDIA